VIVASFRVGARVESLYWFNAFFFTKVRILKSTQLLFIERQIFKIQALLINAR
jgi:hypothetical protein